jgi:hypothetical protein
MHLPGAIGARPLCRISREPDRLSVNLPSTAALALVEGAAAMRCVTSGWRSACGLAAGLAGARRRERAAR